MFERDPRRTIAAELRFEHEPERRRQVGSGPLAGQLDQPSRQISQMPHGTIGRLRNRDLETAAGFEGGDGRRISSAYHSEIKAKVQKPERIEAVVQLNYCCV